MTVAVMGITWYTRRKIKEKQEANDRMEQRYLKVIDRQDQLLDEYRKDY
ncbi:MAG: hypothetical protein QM762_12385 [Chryseolinea sp.]